MIGRLITIPNNRVAVTPFAKISPTVGVCNGVAQVEQRIRLQKLTVVYPPERTDTTKHYCFKAGGFVYLRQADSTMPWRSEVYEIEEGKKFILVPCERIEAYEPPDLT